KKEYFLTDIINIFYNQKLRVETFSLDDKDEILGVNTQKNLSLARKLLNQRLIDLLMDKGVTIIDPATTFVSCDTKIGNNSIVYPFTFIEKNVIIGSNCSLGPFVHLRQGTEINDHTEIGNFVELNRATIAGNVRMKHFGYLGDTSVGREVNIGAGVVVANFDGKNKHHTHIGERAFIGSDTVIVAPVKVGRGAMTGAGAVVTKDVKDKTIVVGVPAKDFSPKTKTKKRKAG
ncbi:MAG: DapH/DapD/GlmU-related protein, partial [Candidatus Omnitrophota bacterium]